MPRLSLTLAVALFGLAPLAGCGDVGEAPEATTTAVETTTDAPITYTGTAIPISATDSTVQWTGAKITGNHLGGFRTVSGDVYVDGDQVTGADVNIDMTSIYSDNDDLTGHLMSDDFFAVETYPSAEFETSDIRPITAADSIQNENATHVVTGRLTMHGQTNEITFPAVVQRTSNGATVEAAFLIDRTLWDINYPGMQNDLINDQVRLELNVAAGDAVADASAR